uniref:Uncharacterized protein n=1 Tax=Amphimedon queenslandica TaxID=400682 RepID=A0A1X7T4U8_AMPQE
MGRIPATLVNIVSRRQPLAVAYLRYYLETTSLNSNRNGRESKPVYYQVLIHLMI